MHACPDAERERVNARQINQSAPAAIRAPPMASNQLEHSSINQWHLGARSNLDDRHFSLTVPTTHTPTSLGLLRYDVRQCIECY